MNGRHHSAISPACKEEKYPTLWMDRQSNGKDYTTRRAITDIYTAQVISDDPVHDGKSQAGTGRLCGKKRVEDILQNLRRDSLAGIAYRYLNRRITIKLNSADRDIDLSSSPHCLLSIHEEVEKNLLELLAVAKEDR